MSFTSLRCSKQSHKHPLKFSSVGFRSSGCRVCRLRLVIGVRVVNLGGLLWLIVRLVALVIAGRLRWLWGLSLIV